jgi:hypothetical protein
MRRFPDAVQREVLHRRSGIVRNSKPVTIPGLRRSTFVLRRAREKYRDSLTPVVAKLVRRRAGMLAEKAGKV